MTIATRPLRYVSIEAFIDYHRGYTERAIRLKIDRGIWRNGQVIQKLPDGHVNIDLEGFERWARGEEAAG